MIIHSFLVIVNILVAVTIACSASPHNIYAPPTPMYVFMFGDEASQVDVCVVCGMKRNILVNYGDTL